MSKKKTRRLRAAAEAAEDELHELADDMMDGLDEAHDYLRRQWDERPVVVAATAMGVGLVIGLLIAGRR